MSSNYRKGQLEEILKRARERGLCGEERPVRTRTFALPPAPRPEPPPKPAHVWGVMNKTEAEFSRMLERLQNEHRIREWAFEPFAVRLANKSTFTADFVSIHPECPLTIADLRALATVPLLTAASNDKLARLVRVLREECNPWMIIFEEVKGPFIRPDARQKFKFAAEQHPWGEWRMWQKAKSGEWGRTRD